jgi:hypothetical protein
MFVCSDACSTLPPSSQTALPAAMSPFSQVSRTPPSMHIPFRYLRAAERRRTDKSQAARLFIGERSIQRTCPFSLKAILSGAESESIEPRPLRGFCARTWPQGNSDKKGTRCETWGCAVYEHARLQQLIGRLMGLRRSAIATVGLALRFRAAMRRPKKVASGLGRHGRTGLTCGGGSVIQIPEWHFSAKTCDLPPRRPDGRRLRLFRSR